MEEEAHASHLSCPFYTPEAASSAHGTNLASHADARRCRGTRCALWLGADESGRCAFLAIAEGLSKNAA